MDAWICQTCHKIDGLRTIDNTCEQPTKESVCNGRVLYQAIKSADVHDIKKERKDE